MKKYFSFVLSGLFVVSSVGCATTPPAPVVSIKPLVSVQKGEHVVAQGDTLYSIAWRYDRDFKEIAKINNIAEPYYLQIGQRLSLAPKLDIESKLISVAQLKKENANNTNNTNNIKSTQAKWHWPTNGKIIKSFSMVNTNSNLRSNKGIDIEGELGTPIQAAMPGKVVYSGSGLRGLGQLLIIKHDDHFLSAYAHNQELMVKEGQYVKQGQTIAKLGNTGSDTAKLHFEIRHKGHPVNPLHYLPSKPTLAFH